MAVLLPPTVEELRAIVGADGADLTDDQLLRLDAAARDLAGILVGAHRDRLYPEAARRREACEQAQREFDLASRRRRYPRERVQKARKRAAAAQGNW